MKDSDLETLWKEDIRQQIIEDNAPHEYTIDCSQTLPFNIEERTIVPRYNRFEGRLRGEWAMEIPQQPYEEPEIVFDRTESSDGNTVEYDASRGDLHVRRSVSTQAIQDADYDIERYVMDEMSRAIRDEIDRELVDRITESARRDGRW